MSNIIIDDEFRALIPPMSDEERRLLEESIVSEGHARDALVTWNGTIVDGHNRYEICTRHNLDFRTEAMAFEDRDAAKIWILQNQLGRRNLVKFVRCELVLKLKETIAAKAKERCIGGGGDKKSQSAKSGLTKSSNPIMSDSSNQIHTRRELAKAAGVAQGTIYQAIEVSKNAPEAVKQDVRSGKKSLNAAYEETVSKMKGTPSTTTTPTPAATRPSPAREQYKINVNRINKIAETLDAVLKLVDRPTLEVSIAEVRLGVKKAVSLMSELRAVISNRESSNVQAN